MNEEDVQKRFICLIVIGLTSTCTCVLFLHEGYKITSELVWFPLSIIIISFTFSLVYASLYMEYRKKRPLFYSKRNVLLKEPHECCICLNDIGRHDNCMLPCNHLYHTKCILSWFHQKRSCPICLRSPNPLLPP